MSNLTQGESFNYPPPFPLQGRLPTAAGMVGESCKKQDSYELAYRQELCLANEKRVEPPCCKTLHISLFFDGTGNNLNNDLYLSNPKHPTNIARLFQATIGSGYAAGVQNQGALFDYGAEKYFKFYLPGVGTPFPEIKDLDYSTFGLAFASKGEDRINWALLRIIDVLKRVLKDPGQNNASLSHGESRAALEKMATSWASFGYGGSHDRYEEFTRQLRLLKPKLKLALEQPEPGKPKLLGIKLYVYGFSRGAATARTFVRWLSELLPPPKKEQDKPQQCLEVDGLMIPLSIEFLGLLDTVASVGTTHMLPFVDGHASWADGTMELPAERTYGGLIKKCVHMVSAHEQRLCFPLDSIRRADGTYPANSNEIIYPGVHSDIGGGYPIGDQGKAIAEDDGYLLSQVVLNDLYSAAFMAGAPLKVSLESLPETLKKDSWRMLGFELNEQFVVAPDLVNRFNAWRELTLNLSTPDKIEDIDAAHYIPVPATVSLEEAAVEQLSWITAWRINRYANGKLVNQPFYQAASDTEAKPELRKAAEVRRDLKQDAVEARRQKAVETLSDAELKEHVDEPGPKDFDPDMSQTQLREAAQEFAEDYSSKARTKRGLMQSVIDNGLESIVFSLNTDDEQVEYRNIKLSGEQKYKILFPYQDEKRNADEKTGLVRALFDDQVHDSRAWFLYATLNSRELWGSYFRYRMIYFATNTNKSLSPVVINGEVVGTGRETKNVIFKLMPKLAADKGAGLAGNATVNAYELIALDRMTKQPLPLLPEALKLKQFTYQPGVIVQHYKRMAAEQQLALARQSMESSWSESHYKSA